MMKIRCPGQAIQHVITDLTSCYQCCQQEGAKIKFRDGSFTCRPCLLSKHQEHFLEGVERELKSV